jgi:hypothetical protein
LECEEREKRCTGIANKMSVRTTKPMLRRIGKRHMGLCQADLKFMLADQNTVQKGEKRSKGRDIKKKVIVEIWKKEEGLTTKSVSWHLCT